MLGAYGRSWTCHKLTLPGLIPVPKPRSEWVIRWDPPSEPRPLWQGDVGVLPTIGGEILLGREQQEVVLRTAQPPDPRVVLHPYLGTIAGVVAWWEGDLVLHAGWFAHRGGAVGLLGAAFAGKSTTAAQLTALGVPVGSEDLLIVHAGAATAGPRCTDLRAPAAAVLAPPDAQRIVVGERDRWRVPTLPCPPEMPLAALVCLEWGDRGEVIPVEPRSRLRVIVEALGDAVPRTSHDEAVLEMCALPMLRWKRPRSLSALPAACELLLNTL